jgi:L-rhamnose isomerase
MDKTVLANYEAAKKVYARYGVDTDEVLAQFAQIPVSLQCWAGDDVKGFEGLGPVASENVVTGSYPYIARNGEELRSDIDEAFSFSPLKHKVNLHSMYAEHHHPRNDLTIEDFREWVDWAKAKGYGLDFNTSFFTHPMMKNGMSCACLDQATRDYWIKAGLDSRKISVAIGKELGQKCYNNFWFPDGMKDQPANRKLYRELLEDSLNQMLQVPYSAEESHYAADMLEGKWFGISTEAFVVGSHEFYIGYAAKHNVGVTLDMGHFRPSEDVSDKISAIYPFVNGMMLHVSRGIHWDSDHVVIEDDALNNMMLELKRGDYYGKVAIGLDYFDASISRVYGWVIGLRAAAKAILYSLLEPTALLQDDEKKGDFGARLLYMEDFHNLPYNAVWEYLLAQKGIVSGLAMEQALKEYEKTVQMKRI